MPLLDGNDHSNGGGGEAAAAKLRGALSSFFSQVPRIFLCVYHRAGE